MTTISCFQLNSILSAALIAAAPTIDTLGYMGGNVGYTSDFTTGYLYNNAVRDTRGFTTFNSGAGNPALDGNGDLAGPGTLCLTTANSSVSPGPVTFGNYWYSFKSPGQATNMTPYDGTKVTVGTPILDADGVTKRYPITILAVAGTAALNFDGVATEHDCPRDGSTSSAGQPEFAAVPLAHYSQFGTLRLMDFLVTNNRSDVAWTDRPANFYIRPYRAGGNPFPWEALVKFVNAVKAYPGSKLKNVLICIPYSVDDTYAPALSAYLTTLGLSSAVQVNVQVSNEHWNPSFVTYSAYQALAMTELQYIANYGTGSPAISSVTSDGTKLTFTTASPIGSYLTTTAPCLLVGGVGGFSLGTVASPVTATKTGSNTFTIPSTGTAGAGQFGVIFNLASTLLGDGVYPTTNGTKGCHLKWFIRRTYQIQQQWSANRPQDKFFFDLQLYGAEAANGNASPPIEFGYAAWLGGGSASSWAYAGALGWYASAAANSTADAVFTDLNNKLSTTLDGQVRAHVYQCKKYGLRPIAYECGPDTQNIPSLQSAVATDARMQTFVTAMLSKWFSNGGEIFSFFHISPTGFKNGDSQGGWPALQSFSDTTSPKIAALIAYLPQTISYANINSGSVVSIPAYYQFGNPRAFVSGGLLGWLDTTTPNFVDISIPIPTAGTYEFKVVGCVGTAPATIDLYREPTPSTDGALLGTSTLAVVAGGWNAGATSADAVAVVDPVTASMTAGIHTIRFSNPSAVSQHGIGLYQLKVTAL